MELKTIRGISFFIDDEDLSLLAGVNWHFHKNAIATTMVIDGVRKYVLLHRKIMNAEKGQIVDHIDGNVANNRKENLRFVTHGQNMMNKRRKINKKTSKYKGVFFDKRTGKFFAAIKQKGNGQYLGSFPCETRAALAYDAAARRVYGQYARANLAGGVLSD